MRRLCVAFGLCLLGSGAFAEPLLSATEKPSEKPVQAPWVKTEEKSDGALNGKSPPHNPPSKPSEPAASQSQGISTKDGREGTDQTQQSAEEGAQFWPPSFERKINFSDSIIALFTLALVYYTARLNNSTIKLWKAGEEQRGLSERVYAQQSADMRESLRISAEAAHASRDAVIIGRDTLIATNRAWVTAEFSIDPKNRFTHIDGVSQLRLQVILQNESDVPAIEIDVQTVILFGDEGRIPYEEHNDICEGFRASDDDRSRGRTLLQRRCFPDGSSKIDSYGQTATSSREKFVPPDQIIGDGTYLSCCISYTFPSDPTGRHQTRYFFNIFAPDTTPHRLDSGLMGTEMYLSNASGSWQGVD
ncbi:hypothetical protein ACYQR9_10690 [Methylobacterium sp. CM6241]